jgi:polysaccharide biosynthesis/export protein
MSSLSWSRRVICIAAAMNMFTGIPEAQTKTEPPTPNSSAATPAAPETNVSATDNSLRLGAGDLLEFNVYNVPELSTKVRVGSNGDVYLPLIDYVHVEGLKPEEAQALVEKRLEDGGFLKDPHVTIFVDEYQSQGVSVLGEVGKPGVYPALGQQRLFDMISIAGGFSDKAGRSITVTHRASPDKPDTVPLARNFSDNPESNVAVFPGDTIVVRKADIVYVVGAVGKPSGFLMDSGTLTVLQAIALAGGTSSTARLGDARIIRKGPAGMSQTPVHLQKMLSAKVPDMPMEADDILFVPTSTGKIVAGRTLQAALQAATAVSVVAIRP